MMTAESVLSAITYYTVKKIRRSQQVHSDGRNIKHVIKYDE